MSSSRSTIAYRRPGAPRVQAQLIHWRRLFWLGVIAAMVIVGDVLLTKYGPALRAGTVETGASFSVSAGSFPTETKAATFAAVLDSAGLPILVRMRPDDRRYQVLVGPYVSTEEAERAQRKLAKWGLGEARLVVDDTMRASPLEATVFGLGGTHHGIVIIAAAGMSSVVFEMTGVPREVETRRTGPTTLDVEIGKHTVVVGDPEPAYEPLRLPDGVSLVRELSAQRDDAESDAMRAHLVVPEGVESRLRLEGKRVYVDLAFPKAPWHVERPKTSLRAPGQADRDSNTEPASETEKVGRVVVDPPSNYQDQLAAVVARFDQIEPFLLSSLEQPEAEVFYALAHSLEDLRESIWALRVPADLENNKMSAISAIARATSALAVDFVGDRSKTVREAVALFEGSMGSMGATGSKGPVQNP